MSNQIVCRMQSIVPMPEQVAKLGCVRIGDGVMLDTGRRLKDEVMNT